MKSHKGGKTMKQEIDKELFDMISSYFLDGEFEDDTGAGRDSLVDDCTAARIYDALLELRKGAKE